MALSSILSGPAGGGVTGTLGGGIGPSTSSATSSAGGKSGDNVATLGDFNFKTQSASGMASVGGIPPLYIGAAVLALVAGIWIGRRK